MKTKRPSVEQIVALLKQAEVVLPLSLHALLAIVQKIGRSTKSAIFGH